MNDEPITDQDRAAVAAQLGREPRGAIAVAHRCPAGHPAVVKVYPLLRDVDPPEPFPTLFWLTCPSLSTRLARLESAGWVSRLEHRLETDEALRRAIDGDHERYAAERWALLTPADRQDVESRGWERDLRERGIGGIANRAALKCLHVHFAHHLARNTALGPVLEELTDLSCCGEGPH